LIGVSLSAADHNYAAQVLPGWMIIGVGAGFAVPTLIAAATARLAAHQTSTGSAIVQMDRQIGGVLGIAVLVVVMGSAQLGAAALHDFKISWYWSAGFIVLAALTSLRLLAPPRKAGAVAGTEAAQAPAA
jgi:hypothetical protein